MAGPPHTHANRHPVEGDHAHRHGHGAHGETCAHAHDRVHAAGEVLREAEEICRARGARLTPIRRRVLETLLSTHRPLGAYDLAGLLPREAGKPLAPITIYRALDFLMEHGLVHRLESRNAFVACPHTHGPGDMVLFLICEACGGVDERTPAEVSTAMSAALAREGFQARLPVLEIVGRCAHCRVSPAPA